ncbi:hypothetical protein OO25_19690 [Phaeobacter sp. S60]|nr:hypothetical protein OO25_19690 [Phaeobacter sp. S60]
MKPFFLAALAVALVSGCAQVPSAVETQNADYGRPIPQSECEKVAKRNISSVLKDPGSAQYRHGTCRKIAVHSIPAFGLPKQYGYAIVTDVNSRNNFGGDTGFQRWETLIRDGRAIRRTHPRDGFQIPY